MIKLSQYLTNMSFKNLILLIFFSIFILSCGIKFKKSEPISGPEKARKNIEEGRGASISSAAKRLRGGKTTYEFSTANPMWRASLETLDFLPLTTVDYSGGIIITDWYSDETSNSDESIKISVRFLANDIRSESLKIIVHQRLCKNSQNCRIVLLNQSSIKDELYNTILKKASLIEKQQKEKK